MSPAWKQNRPHGDCCYDSSISTHAQPTPAEQVALLVHNLVPGSKTFPDKPTMYWRVGAYSVRSSAFSVYLGCKLALCAGIKGVNLILPVPK